MTHQRCPHVKGALFALVALFALLLSACETNVGTSVTATGDTTAEIVVSVTVDGELAALLRNDGDSARKIEKIFADAAGVNPSRTDADETITFEAAMPRDRVGDASGLTGVRSITVRPDERLGGENVIVDVELVDADKLRAALLDVDDEGGAQAMLSQTFVTLQVTLHGGVTDASSPGDKVAFTVDGDTVTSVRRLEDNTTGTLTVSGSTASRPWWSWVIRGLALCTVACAAWLVLRPRLRRAKML